MDERQREVAIQAEDGSFEIIQLQTPEDMHKFMLWHKRKELQKKVRDLRSLIWNETAENFRIINSSLEIDDELKECMKSQAVLKRKHPGACRNTIEVKSNKEMRLRKNLRTLKEELESETYELEYLRSIRKDLDSKIEHQKGQQNFAGLEEHDLY